MVYALNRFGDDALLGGIQEGSLWHPNISIFQNPITSKMFHIFAHLGFLWIKLTSAAIRPSEPAIFASSVDGARPTNGSGLMNDLRFQYTGPADAQAEVQCDGANYGTSLDAWSCGNALLQIDRDDTRPVTFGQRGSVPPAQQTLPLRTSSGKLPVLSLAGFYAALED